jgi:hypothetical protein
MDSDTGGGGNTPQKGAALVGVADAGRTVDGECGEEERLTRSAARRNG